MCKMIGQCTLISSLPGKVSRTLVKSWLAEPGKLEINRRNPVVFLSVYLLIHSSNWQLGPH